MVSHGTTFRMVPPGRFRLPMRAFRAKDASTLTPFAGIEPVSPGSIHRPFRTGHGPWHTNNHPATQPFLFWIAVSRRRMPGRVLRQTPRKRPTVPAGPCNAPRPPRDFVHTNSQWTTESPFGTG